MALFTCPECGSIISDKANYCPHCGCPKAYFVQKVVVSLTGSCIVFCLKGDGTIYVGGSEGSAGLLYKNELNFYRENLLGLTHIKEIASAGPGHVLLLTEEGHVLGYGEGKRGQLDIEDWDSNIISIAASGSCSAGLTANGTVCVTHEDYKDAVKEWRNIKKIALGGNSIAGLRMDGTVVAFENWTIYGPEDPYTYESTVISDGKRNLIYDWSNIIDIAAGESFVVGLCSDGTIKLSPNAWLGTQRGIVMREVEKIKNIKKIWGCSNYVVALDCYDSIHQLGGSGFLGQKVNNWTNISNVFLSDCWIVGVCKNGEILTVGENLYRELDFIQGLFK